MSTNDEKIFYRASNRQHKIDDIIEPNQVPYEYETNSQKITEEMLRRYNEEYSSNRADAVYLWRDRSIVETAIRVKKYKYGYACSVRSEDFIQVGKIDEYNALDKKLEKLLTENNCYKKPVTEKMLISLASEEFVLNHVEKIIAPQKTYLQTGVVPDGRNIEFLFKKAKVVEIFSTKQERLLDRNTYSIEF